MRRKLGALLVLGTVLAALTPFVSSERAAASAPGGGGGYYSRQRQTDGALLEAGWAADWKYTGGYASPGADGGYALTHLFFNVGQQDLNQQNLIYPPSGPPPWTEVGITQGALLHSNSLGPQFFWSVCQSGHAPFNAPCNEATDYYEAPMTPAPALVVGHVYEFYGQVNSHDGYWWWDLDTTDLTAGGARIRGGGHANYSYTATCCASAGETGEEVNTAGDGEGSVQLPLADFYNLRLRQNGSSTYVGAGASRVYPSGGNTTCQVDDAVSGEPCGGGTLFSHAWYSKYYSIGIKWN